jgi:Domain of unknown function (DUF4833)
MNMRNIRSGFYIIFLFPATTILVQDSLRFPVPTGIPKQLFYLQRTQNTNTVIYELNIKYGVIDNAEPVHPYSAARNCHSFNTAYLVINVPCSFTLSL